MLCETARKYFEGEYNCAESLVMAVNDYYKIECSHVPEIATGFGAGMGGRGSVCGALVGCVIAIGMIYSKIEMSREEKKDAISKKVIEFFDKFEEKYGSIECMTLIQFDVLKPEEIGDIATANLRDLVKRGVIEIKCFDYVEYACRFLEEVARDALERR